MIRSRLIALAVLLTLTLITFAPASQAASHRVLAYYEWADKYNAIPYDASTIPYHQLTHIIHSNIAPAPQGDGSLGVPIGFLDPELISRAHQAGVKVEVCIAGPPYLFAKIDADANLRATFAQNLANFVIANGYDGVDFDYEVPYNMVEATNFTLMAQALRAVLPAGQYLISAAVTSHPGWWGVYDFPGLIPVLDFFNVMTYDFHGPWTNHAGHNSPLYLSPLDPGQEGSLKTSTDLYLFEFGVPPEQINLGTAFYGYGFDVNGLWYFCGCEQTLSFTYVQMQKMIASGGWTEHVDPLASAPYATNPDTPHIGFLTYDTPASTALKVDFALNTRGLGGVFMWELSQDYDGKTQPLMDALYKASLKSPAHNTTAANKSLRKENIDWLLPDE